MKIYLETSVPNFLFAEDAPERQNKTRIFWEWLKLGTEQVFVSQLVLDEIADAPEAKRVRLETALRELNPTVLSVDERAVGLADLLVRRGVVPARFSDDALHLAVALLNEIDVLASWNLEHIVKLKTVMAVNLVCVEYGFKPLRIHTPQEIAP
jgi:predicted nucleic acid-binding protein